MRTPFLVIAIALSFLPLTGFIAGCGDEEGDLGECPSGSEAQQAAGQAVLESRCLSCHASQLTGAARQGAPDEYNFDDLAVVKDEAGEIYAEVEEGAMPPGGALPSADVENLRIWLACGAPDTTPGN